MEQIQVKPRRRYFRKQSVMTETTRMLVKYMQQAPNGVVNLSVAADQLELPVRRLREICKIMEDIGYIAKHGRGERKWLGGDTEENIMKQIKETHQRNKQLDQEIQKISREVGQIKKKIATFPSWKVKDFLNIMKKLGLREMVVLRGKAERTTVESGHITVKLSTGSSGKTPKAWIFRRVGDDDIIWAQIRRIQK